eukprot:8678873-Ditylum_brightwellii.AAC.1
MRGQDFVRKLMGRAKMDPIVGHRQQIATLVKSKKSKDIKREDHNEMGLLVDSLDIGDNLV